MDNSGGGCITTIIVSVVGLLVIWLFASLGSSDDGEQACTTAEHCEQQQFWREQGRVDRER